MRDEATDMIGVGVREKECVDVEAPLSIARQAVAQLPGYVRRVIVGIVSGATDVDVDEDASPAGELDERHVAVADAEMRCDRCRHGVPRVPRERR